MSRRVAFLAVALSISLSVTAGAADWPAFRGQNGNGLSPEKAAPTTWGPEQNIKWKVPLPAGGNSSPIVAGGRVFLTCAEDAKGTRRSLYCFDRADGKRLWAKTVLPDPTHEQNPYAGSTPVSDGERVVVWHGSAGVFCYDMDGKELWTYDVGVVRHIWGYASSPIIHGDLVILNVGPGERSIVIALDKKTGELEWRGAPIHGAEDKSPLTGNWLGSWSTPVVAQGHEREVVLVPAPDHVRAYDVASGRVMSSWKGTGPLAYTDVMVAGEGKDAVAVYMSGYGGPSIAFKPGGKGGYLAEPTWRHDDKPPQRVGTGVVIGRHIYMPSEPAIQCIEVDTGKVVWQQRFPGQTFWASVTAVGNRCYVTSQQGVTYVFDADPAKYVPVAQNDLGETSNSTIAVSDGQIFHRTYEHLYCIAEP
jgi:outer membrane protein assembly factor BamB